MRTVAGFIGGFVSAAVLMLVGPMLAAVVLVATGRAPQVWELQAMQARSNHYACTMEGSAADETRVTPATSSTSSLTLACAHEQPSGWLTHATDLDHYFQLGQWVRLFPPWDVAFVNDGRQAHYRRHRATAVEVLSLSVEVAESDAELVAFRDSLWDSQMADVEPATEAWDLRLVEYRDQYDARFKAAFEAALQERYGVDHPDGRTAELTAELVMSQADGARMDDELAALLGARPEVGDTPTDNADARGHLEYGSLGISNDDLEVHSATFDDLQEGTELLLAHLCRIGCTQIRYGYWEYEDDL